MSDELVVEWLLHFLAKRTDACKTAFKFHLSPNIIVDAPRLTARITGDLVFTMGNAPLPTIHITLKI